MNYSPQHLAAFARYRDAGYSVKRLDEDDLRALNEDRNFHAEVRAELGRRMQSDTPAVAPSPPTPPTHAVSKAWAADATEEAKTTWLRKHMKALVSVSGVVDLIAKTVFPLFDAMNARNQERNTRIAALETRCASLDQLCAGLKSELVDLRTELQNREYKGVFRHGQTYPRGAFVTHQGSMWNALAETDAQPGISTPESRAWQLVVKHGRDLR